MYWRVNIRSGAMIFPHSWSNQRTHASIRSNRHMYICSKGNLRIQSKLIKGQVVNLHFNSSLQFHGMNMYNWDNCSLAIYSLNKTIVDDYFKRAVFFSHFHLDGLSQAAGERVNQPTNRDFAKDIMKLNFFLNFKLQNDIASRIGAAAYQLGKTSSRTITDVKQCWAWLVLGWENVQILSECCW